MELDNGLGFLGLGLPRGDFDRLTGGLVGVGCAAWAQGVGGLLSRDLIG